ncbi:MAG: phosphatidate cytidylyltransferase [Defluviitaleaceae bacterium]|nr:phosphatidate cytidylyltransferase [Defluviitaleaceae bacterium]
MKQRILVGIALLVMLVTVLYFGGIYLRLFLVGASIMAIKELASAFKLKTPYFALLFAVVYFAFFIVNTSYLLAMLMVWLLINMIYMVFKNEHPNNVFANFFLPIYIVIPFSFIYLLSHYGLVVLLIFTTSWGSDTFAYFVGKFFGKRKLTKMSPSKTVEGAIGGVAGGTVLSLIVWNFIHPITILPVLIFFLISILSEIGDLSASVIKRHMGIKDYSNLMPGHGGILDRFDSVLFTAPLVYFSLEFLL